jgi:uncharacterized protein (TIGR00251 family)
VKVVLELHVQPGARRTEFAGMHGDRVKIRLAAPPVDGRANAALIEFLARHYGVPKASVTIDAGLGSRKKRVTIWKKPTTSSPR